MPKKILLIENDAGFASQLTASLEATGFEARLTGDGKEGLELARDWAPAAVVLCVELQGMSGYLVCQKLKKDDALKAIPLVLTSAEATEETFEKHRTLKARADEYLLKPFEPEALVEKLGALVGFPEGVPAPAEAVQEGDEELVSLEEEIGIGAAEGEPEIEVPGLDLESLPDEPAGSQRGASMDEDLRLLDDAFDGLSAPPAARDAAAALDELAGEKPMAGDEVDAAAASLPEEDEGSARADLGGLDDDAALGALAGIDETLSPGLSLDRESTPVAVATPPPRPPRRSATAALLRAAGIKLLDEDTAPTEALVPRPSAPERGDGAEPGPREGELREALERTRDELSARDGELRDLRRKVEALSRRADEADAELAQANTRSDAAQEKARKAEGDARTGRDEARRAAEQARAAEADLADARRKASEAERRAADQEKRTGELEKRALAAEEELRRKVEENAAASDALARAESLEREADELRTELLVARGEAEGVQGEVDKRTAELRKRVVDLEATNAKNEERVVKAYQKIKADEKVRDKVRKALAIATQLLEDGLPAESPADKERRAAAGGRE
ncbi:MAG TPA: response regulator [Anaeromyxobacter sp.]